MRFSSKTGETSDFAHRLLKRNLHFGQCRDRYPHRRFLIEHVIFPHIAVGEDIVAELLRVPEARTMAQHQPGMRAQHGDIIGYGAGVGWPCANVDHSDALAVSFGQMKGRHLRRAPDRYRYMERESSVPLSLWQIASRLGAATYARPGHLFPFDRSYVGLSRARRLSQTLSAQSQMEHGCDSGGQGGDREALFDT
jgi:hypothetical protein